MPVGKTAFRVILIITVLQFTCSVFSICVAQDQKEILKPGKASEFIDTLFIDRDLNNWSFRIFTNFKEQRFRLIDPNDKLVFAPNNPHGIGLGIASSKIIIDLAINIKAGDPEATKRFDGQAAFISKQHFFDFFIQDYEGFRVKSDLDENGAFRGDMKAFSAGLNYLYMFNSEKFSLLALKSGLARQRKTAISPGLGAFFLIADVTADSSFIPQEISANFNEQANLEDYFGFGIGINGGISTFFALPGNFFASITVIAGAGLMFQNVTTGTLEYKPSDKLMLQTNLGGGFGYNSDRWYLNLVADIGMYFVDLDFQNTGRFQVSNAKFAVGYKLFAKD